MIQLDQSPEKNHTIDKE